jgi:hypothetical protein
MATIKEAVDKIRQVGTTNARITPVGNRCKIEIYTGKEWVTLLSNLERNIAEDVIRQATNRVILG